MERYLKWTLMMCKNLTSTLILTIMVQDTPRYLLDTAVESTMMTTAFSSFFLCQIANQFT